MRFFKTSVSESESGILDLNYSRDGAAVDEKASLGSLFGVPTESSTRLYLAGGFGSLRNQAGFVV